MLWKGLWLCLPGRVSLAIWTRLPQEPATPHLTLSLNPPNPQTLSQVYLEMNSCHGSPRSGRVEAVSVWWPLRGEGHPLVHVEQAPVQAPRHHVPQRQDREGRSLRSMGSWPVVKGRSDRGGFHMHFSKLIGWQYVFKGGRVLRWLVVHCIASNQTVIILDLRGWPSP